MADRPDRTHRSGARSALARPGRRPVRRARAAPQRHGDARRARPADRARRELAVRQPAPARARAVHAAHGGRAAARARRRSCRPARRLRALHVRRWPLRAGAVARLASIAGVTVRTLAIAAPRSALAADDPDARFALLNEAFATDGAVDRAARGADCPACIELMFVATAAAAAGTSYPRLAACGRDVAPGARRAACEPRRAMPTSCNAAVERRRCAPAPASIITACSRRGDAADLVRHARRARLAQRRELPAAHCMQPRRAHPPARRSTSSSPARRARFDLHCASRRGSASRCTTLFALDRARRRRTRSRDRAFAASPPSAARRIQQQGDRARRRARRRFAPDRCAACSPAPTPRSTCVRSSRSTPTRCAATTARPPASSTSRCCSICCPAASTARTAQSCCSGRSSKTSCRSIDVPELRGEIEQLSPASSTRRPRSKELFVMAMQRELAIAPRYDVERVRRDFPILRAHGATASRWCTSTAPPRRSAR